MSEAASDEMNKRSVYKGAKMRLVYHVIFVFLCLITCHCTRGEIGNDHHCDRDEDGVCKKKKNLSCDEDSDEPCFFEEEEEEIPVILHSPEDDKKYSTDDYPEFPYLTRFDIAGKNVGDTIEKLIDGTTFKMKLLAKKPLLFEIGDAITDSEMEHITTKATSPFYSEGLFKSEARGGLTPEDTFKPSTAAGRAYGPAGFFINWDLNEDHKIDKHEAKMFCRNYNFLYFNDEEIKEMFTTLKIKEFDDDVIEESEFDGMNTLGIEDYLNRMMREHPKHRQRTSEQVWLPMAIEFDPVLAGIRERFGKLFKIPQRILLGSEHMQIVRYVPGGHYHAHHDTETHKAVDKPCCHHTNDKTILQHARCRLCRFMTIMFYLNQPEEGGETAFPAADNITYSEAEFRRRGNPAKDLYNLHEHCYDANLVVKPKRGYAVAWYNHHTDPETNWLGEIDPWSLHGGCTLKKGEKWIANLWLTAPYAKDVDKMSMYSVEYMEKTKDEL